MLYFPLYFLWPCQPPWHCLTTLSMPLPTSGTLHLLLPLPRMLFSQLLTEWLALHFSIFCSHGTCRRGLLWLPKSKLESIFCHAQEIPISLLTTVHISNWFHIADPWLCLLISPSLTSPLTLLVFLHYVCHQLTILYESTCSISFPRYWNVSLQVQNYIPSLLKQCVAYNCSIPMVNEEILCLSLLPSLLNLLDFILQRIFLYEK